MFIERKIEMADTVPRMDDLLNNAIANIVALQSQTESLLMYGRKYYVNPDAAVGSNSKQVVGFQNKS